MHARLMMSAHVQLHHLMVSLLPTAPLLINKVVQSNSPPLGTSLVARSPLSTKLLPLVVFNNFKDTKVANTCSILDIPLHLTVLQTRCITNVIIPLF